MDNPIGRPLFAEAKSHAYSICALPWVGPKRLHVGELSSLPDRKANPLMVEYDCADDNRVSTPVGKERHERLSLSGTVKIPICWVKGD